MAVINGADGDDVLVGGSGANTLNGNDGNDVLMGGPLVVPSASCPLDKLNGGAGDDWFDMGPDDNQTTLTQDDCNQVIAGGSGTDVVDYSKRSANGVLLVKLDGVTASGEQSLTSREADKIGSDVEVVLAGGGPDLITGSDNADYLFGGPGNDHIYGGKGDDHLYGGAGDDSLYGDLGNDTFYELSAFPASTAANEALRGTTWAGLGAAIYGSEKPGAGDDLIMGGSDLSEVNKVDFTDAPNPVAAAICSDATAINANLKSCAIGSSDYVHVSLDGTTATAGASGTHNSYINVEYLAGSLTQPNVFIGSANAEVFEGGSGLDVILGQGGQDTLSGSPDPATGVSKDNTSIDVLCGGDDDDYVAGGSNSIVEGEGQMDQAHAHLLTTAVLLGGTSVQAPSFCHDPSNAVYTMTAGTNMCFGSTNKTHCAN
jgi:Ca2+-binding RTX toxin-like protein